MARARVDRAIGSHGHGQNQRLVGTEKSLQGRTQSEPALMIQREVFEFACQKIVIGGSLPDLRAGAPQGHGGERHQEHG